MTTKVFGLALPLVVSLGAYLPMGASSPAAVLAKTPIANAKRTITTSASPAVIFFGDSLATQAQHYFDKDVEATGDYTVANSTYPGTAPCNFMPTMQTDISSGDIPKVVVLDFSGNALGTCMTGYTPYTEAYYHKYKSDTATIVNEWHAVGTEVIVAGYPAMVPSSPNPLWDKLNYVYKNLAANNAGVAYVNSGAAVMFHNRDFAWELPCLPSENTPSTCGGGGSNIVRADDGVHFCPGHVKADNWSICDVYSSGAVRYAQAMADPVDTFLNSGSISSYNGPPLPAYGTDVIVAPGQIDPYTFSGSGAIVGAAENDLGNGLMAITADGNYYNYGGASASNCVFPSASDYKGIAADPNGATPGFWVYTASGHIYQCNGTPFYGSVWSKNRGQLSSASMVSMASTPNGHGYWALMSNGIVIPYGNAQDYSGQAVLSGLKPVVIESTPDGLGYFVVTAEGNVYAHGDAVFYGSPVSERTPLLTAVVGFQDVDGGYALATDNGAVYTFGVFGYYGDASGKSITVGGFVSHRTNAGYWLVKTNGQTENYGPAPVMAPA